MAAHALQVVVTKPLVDRATKRDSRHCMIAEAIKQARPDYKNIVVDLQTIRWTNPRTEKRYICLTPEIAAQALVDFDQGRDIEPFTFNCKPVQTTPTMLREPDPTKPGGVKQTRRAGRKQLQLDGTVKGGNVLPRGHLQGSADVHVANKAARREAALPTPKAEDSNVRRSQPRYRQYGRRLLKG